MHYTKTPNFSAVAGDTGFPISVASQMIASGAIKATGVQSLKTAIFPRPFLEEIGGRGIRNSRPT